MEGRVIIVGEEEGSRARRENSVLAGVWERNETNERTNEEGKVSFEF